MPRLKYKAPTYCRHKSSGQAVVTCHGRDHYLGKYGSPESIEKYKQLVAEWAAASALPQPLELKKDPVGSDLRVNELVESYLAQRYNQLLWMT
jgi:hypothetical protein